jgi:hypothetical protein
VDPKDPKKPAQNKKQDKKKGPDTSFKNILSKMVPYINAQYAEHILKSIGVADCNAKTTERDVDTLIQAAKGCQEFARSLETMETIPGFLVYTDKPVQEKKAVPQGLEDKLP